MKKIQLLLLGWLMAFAAVAHDVSIHLVDANGKVLPQGRQGAITRPLLDAYYNGQQLAIADDGGFLVPGLTEAGTYTLELRDAFGLLPSEDREQEIEAVFEWDGQKNSTYAEMTDFYYLDFKLTGLTEADKKYLAEQEESIYVYLTGKEEYAHINISFYPYYGELVEHAYCFWNIDRMGDFLKWEFDNQYLGRSQGEIANLDQVQGDIEIHATKGKSLLTLGKVTGLDGKPLQQFFMDGRYFENYQEGTWKKYLPVDKNVELTFLVKQFFPWTEKIQLTEGEPYHLNVDLRENTPITFQVKQRDNSPLEGAAIYLKAGFEKRDTLAISGADGTCVAYSKQPGTCDFYVDSDLKFHAPKHYILPVGESATTFEVGYVGDLLVQLQLKGGNRILQQYGEPIRWGYLLDSAAAEEDFIDANKAINLRDYIVQGDDIVTGCMISPATLDIQQAVARIEVYTYDSFAMLPMIGQVHLLTGDIQETFDLTQLQPITFMVPAGFKFNDYGAMLKIDGKYAPIHRIMDEAGQFKALQLHMNPGRYHWTTRLVPEGHDEHYSYPFAKPQSFVVENAPKEVCFIYSEDNYYGLNLKVKDENGMAFGEIPIQFNKVNSTTQGHLAETDHTGKGLLFSEEKGLHYYSVQPSGYLPQIDTVMVDEERLTCNVSYQNYFVCNVDVNLDRFSVNQMYNMYWYDNAHLDIEEDDEDDYGPNRNSLRNDWKEDGAYDASTRLVVRPGYLYCDFFVSENESSERIYLPIFLRVGEQNQDFLIDAQAMRIVNFETEIDPEIAGAESYDLSWEVYIANAAGEKVCNSYGDRKKILLAPGQYTAYYDFYGEGAALAGSKIVAVPFEVTDKDLTVVGKLTLEGRQRIEINIQNAGTDVTCNSVWLANKEGSSDFTWNGPVGHTYEQGHFFYVIDELLKAGKVYSTEYVGEVTLNGKDQVLQADFSDYRFFQLMMHLKGSEQLWIPEDGYCDLIGDNLMNEDFELDFYDEEEQRLALKPGHYTLIYNGYRNSEKFKLYAELKVTADSPEAIHVNFTEKVPTGIEQLIDNGALKAKLVNRQLHIMGEAKAPVQVDILSVDGRCVQRCKVANGAVLSLDNQLHGVYIVRLQQGMKVVNQKFLF